MLILQNWIIAFPWHICHVFYLIHLLWLLRFGIGRFTTEEEIDYTAEKCISHVTRLREMRWIIQCLSSCEEWLNIRYGFFLAVRCGRWSRKALIWRTSNGPSTERENQVEEENSLFTCINIYPCISVLPCSVYTIPQMPVGQAATYVWLCECSASEWMLPCFKIHVIHGLNFSQVLFVGSSSSWSIMEILPPMSCLSFSSYTPHPCLCVVSGLTDGYILRC